MSDFDYSHASHRSEKKLMVILSVIAVTLIVSFLAVQVNFAKIRQQPVALPSPSPVLSAYDEPIITSPQSKALVTSPLTVAGTVPPGWMFEGSLPVSLYGSDDVRIASATAGETVPGNWQTGTPVGFTVDISFTTSATSGYVVIAKDNPSGLPENDDSIKIPVRFK